MSGFTNTKRVDASSNMEFKAALDKALMEQMQKLSIKQKKAEKEQVANIFIFVTTFVYLKKTRRPFCDIILFKYLSR